MARRRRGGADPDRENVDLGAPEHAWWAAGSTDPFAEPEPEPEVEAVPETDSEPEAPAAPVAPTGRDPYAVLRVAPTADWDDIVAAHRTLVRWWHPDGLGHHSTPGEREFCAARLREISEAYRELRVRRNR